VPCLVPADSRRKGYLHTEEVKELAPLLVLLAADSTTIPALRRDIDVTLPSLWPIWLAEAVSEISHTDLDVMTAGRFRGSR
jgi:hypothetical protein